MRRQRRRETWTDLFSRLGTSILDVLGAELGVLAEEWKRSGVLVRNAAVILVAVGFCFFWWIPVAIFGVVQLFTLIPGVGMLGATWISVALGVLLMGGAAGFAWVRYLAKLESPVAQAKRRYGDHLEWWRSEILPPPERTLTEGGGTDGRQG